MITLRLPWLEGSILIPLLGAIWVSRLRSPERAQTHTIVVLSLALVCTVGAWWDFASLDAVEAHDRWDVASQFLGHGNLAIDELSAPLLPLASLVYLMTGITALRTKVQRFSFAGNLASEAILLATLSCREPWTIIVLLAAGTFPPWLELRLRNKSTRVFAAHMSLFVLLLAAGWTLIAFSGDSTSRSISAITLLTAAVFVRSGIVPLHCWVTDLFEHATFGTALLFVTPMAGAYAAVRLVLPFAPGWMLSSIGLIALITTVYAAGMALVQREARRFFCYLFLSHSALVLVGMGIASPVGLTGGLCVWLSVGLALSGFGLTLWSIEARTGRLSLATFHGMYEHTPTLAAFFLLTGLASVGFPGTFGFIGTELLMDGTVRAYPYAGHAVVIAAALNGIAILQAYFRVFTGTRHTSTISLRSRLSERAAAVVLTLLIFGGGLFPQPGIASRYHAAVGLIRNRVASSGSLVQRAAVEKPRQRPSVR